MRVAIIGAGAIGGMVGGKLALAGADVTLIARGPHLAAIRENGLTLLMTEADGGEQLIHPISATDDIRAAGTQDVVIVALKAHQIAAVADDLPLLYGSDTIVITMQNGIPWWYFEKHGGPFEGHKIECLDPDGALAGAIPAERIIGCIAYPAAVIKAPGVIRQIEGNKFPVGEPDGTRTPRVEMISGMFEEAGFKSRILDDIRSETWLKAWGNLAFNPISAMTGATLEDICRFPHTRELSYDMMLEAQEVANCLGVTFRHTIDKRIAGAEAVGPHKTSMLQDVESGREMEIDALIGVVAELGRLTNTPTPRIDAMFCCLSLLGEIQVRQRAATKRAESEIQVQVTSPLSKIPEMAGVA